MLIFPGPWASCLFANSPKEDQRSRSISPPANYQRRPECQEWGMHLCGRRSWRAYSGHRNDRSHLAFWQGRLV